LFKTDFTKAVVAICVLSVENDAVGADGVPVSAGEAKAALRSSAVCVAVDTGFAESAVLSTEPSPTIDFVIPETVPVKVGETIGAYVDAAVAEASLASSAVCVAVDTGLFASEVLSTSESPTDDFVNPETAVETAESA